MADVIDEEGESVRGSGSPPCNVERGSSVMSVGEGEVEAGGLKFELEDVVESVDMVTRRTASRPSLAVSMLLKPKDRRTLSITR